MALTATATKSVRLAASLSLGMLNPHVVAFSPVKKNIMYAMNSFETVEDSFGPLVRRLKLERTSFPRMIVFTRSLSMAGNIYLYLMSELGDEATEPKDAPNLSTLRLVDMFTSVIEKDHKDSIIKLFTRESHLRIVIAGG